jgi:hypothetical protein
MAITIELPPGLQMQAEAYAKAKGQSIAELMLTGLKEILTTGNGSERGVETDSEAEADVWEQVFEEVMEDYANVWQRLAQL